MRDSKKKNKVRTTVSLPRPVYEEARSLLENQAVPAGSINSLFVAAISAYLKVLKRRQIDAQFAPMANDEEYQKSSQRITEEFNQSDWEALAGMEMDRERA